MSRFKFRVWDKRLNRYLGNNDPTQMLLENGNLAYLDDEGMKFYEVEQCTGLKDKNGKLIYEGDIITYYHNKKKLVPVTDRKPFEAPYGNDEETGLPLQYRTVKIIKYKGYVSIDAIGGVELNLRHNLHWWKSLEKDVLTQVEVIGNIHENEELKDD